MEPSPITPLGARTPHMHPMLPKVVAAFALVIVVGAYFVWADYSGHWPYQPYHEPSAVPTGHTGLQYENEQYGFFIALPDSWQGFTIITDQWEGRDVASGTVTEHGPLIKIRNPNWTSAAPYEDMPVMVFTSAQWAKVQAQTLSLGAAPIGPSELAHNSSYIFALPARYNYDFATGYEEVDQLVHQLQAFDPAQ